MHKIKLIIHTGPRAVDQGEQEIGLDTLAGDLVIYCRKDYHLPEQDTRGNLIQYALFIERDGKRVPLDLQRSLRSLRLQNYAVLYLADIAWLWWPVGGTDRLRPPEARALQPYPPPPAPPQRVEPVTPPTEVQPIICIVELAPSCSRTVSESGLVITRRYLLDTLPRTTVGREQARLLLGLESPLQAVSNRPEGHCALLWTRGWYLHAYRPVYMPGSGAKLDHGETLALDQTTQVVLGREGWLITFRLSSTLLPRY